MTIQKNRCTRESGNVFIIVLMGIVLFAALMFTFSRSTRQGGESMSKKQVDVAISDILSYAQALERATVRVMNGGRYSETQIDFENGIAAGYTNAGCADVQCEVFNASGGGTAWQSPQDSFSNGNEWTIAGENAVPGVGDDTRADLVLLLSGLSSANCRSVNEKLGLGAVLPQDADGIDTTKFIGTFANSARIGLSADLNGVRAACVQSTLPNPDEYVFYYVLWDR